MTGALRGTHLPAEVKLALIGAITEAKDAGFPIVKACEVLMLEARRFHRWLQGRDPKTLTVADVADVPPVPKTTPHQITGDERAAIIEAADDEANSDKAHRKLAHHLSRTDKAFVSESTVLRVLRSVALVCRFQGRVGKPKTVKPETTVEAPNEMWAWDISYCLVGEQFWYLIAIIDMFSRKIVAHAVRPSATSDDVKDVFDKALANEGLLGMDAKMPKSLSDRGPQMRSKTIRRFFYDLGITQIFSRPRTPSDNATIESFFATIKGERLYHGAYSDPIELADDADAFVMYYNEERLHMGIGFVTPAEKHDGRAEGIIAARRVGMDERASEDCRSIEGVRRVQMLLNSLRNCVKSSDADRPTDNDCELHSGGKEGSDAGRSSTG